MVRYWSIGRSVSHLQVRRGLPLTSAARARRARGFDIFKEAHGAGRGVTWSVHGLEPDAQGKLNVALTPSRNYASVNAVEVLDESK